MSDKEDATRSLSSTRKLGLGKNSWKLEVHRQNSSHLSNAGKQAHEMDKSSLSLNVILIMRSYSTELKEYANQDLRMGPSSVLSGHTDFPLRSNYYYVAPGLLLNPGDWWAVA